jgi:hypothetical protein
MLAGNDTPFEVKVQEQIIQALAYELSSAMAGPFGRSSRLIAKVDIVVW